MNIIVFYICLYSCGSPGNNSQHYQTKHPVCRPVGRQRAKSSPCNTLHGAPLWIENWQNIFVVNNRIMCRTFSISTQTTTCFPLQLQRQRWTIVVPLAVAVWKNNKYSAVSLMLFHGWWVANDYEARLRWFVRPPAETVNEYPNSICNFRALVSGAFSCYRIRFPCATCWWLRIHLEQMSSGVGLGNLVWELTTRSITRSLAGSNVFNEMELHRSKQVVQ